MSDAEKMGDTLNLSTWTLINSHGEIMSGDADSESSDSSIEVIHFEEGEIATFSSRHVKDSDNKKSDDLDEELQELNVEQCVNLSPIHTERDALDSNDCDEKPCDTDLIDSGVNTLNSHVESLSTDQKNLEDINSSMCMETPEPDASQSQVPGSDAIQSQVPGPDASQSQVPGPDASQSQVPGSDAIQSQVPQPDARQSQVPQPDARQSQDPESEDGMASNKPTDFLLGAMTGCVDEDAFALDKDKNLKSEDTSRETSPMNNQFSACCLNQLPKPCDNSEIVTEQVPSPSTISYEEVDKFPLSEDESTGSSVPVRGDSDTDSDFVRLDCVILRDMVNDIRRIIIPVSVSTSDSSIGPSFSFLRNAGAQEPDYLDRSSASLYAQESDYLDRSSASLYEEDLDDDTESSTEDGVDDRIESEQSEAGSLSAQNDIGDLSVFADIGDLPLDAGNVPRNYIHSPNNHLSTILNIIVLVAAILTMGISLGIIVGTDLEMEEWQHALDTQSMKVIILEQQLQSKLQEAHSLQRKIDTLQKQFKETKVTAKGFEKAFDQLIYDALVKDKSTETGWLQLKEAFDSFISCDRTLQDLAHMSFEATFSMMTCDKSIRAFLDSFTLIKNESNPDNLAAQKQEVNREVKQDVTKEERSYSSNKVTHAAPVAAPVPLNIKDLQKSLTREQQRALRWQHLYLAERRQKERERENEEWEDEREREIWENEKEHLDQVECLQKLMSANVTRLTQYIAQWNLSVFDDFANLSLMLSGVAELKQSVLDSIQNVWERAEEMFDNEQKKNSDWADQKSFNRDISDHQLLCIYVTKILQEISAWPDEETLFEYLTMKVTSVRQLLEKVTLTEPVHHIWIHTDNVLKSIKIKFDQGLDKNLDKRQIVDDLTRSFYDLKQSLEKEFSEENQRNIRVEKPDEVVKDGHNFESDPNNYKKPSSWRKRIGKLLKKTGASVKEKVKNTWQNIKSIWHSKKTAWHKIKNLWHEKKPSLLNMAKGFTDHVMNVSSKFKKLCTSLPKAIFNNNKNDAKVDINSKSVHKARKQWQKDILHEPCTVFGKFSPECNSDKKQLKKSIKKINHEFNDVLKLSNPGEAHKIKSHQARFIYQKFRSFYEHWGSSKLLLKTDLDWVACHCGQWLDFINKASHLDLNSCNYIRLQDNLDETYCGVNKPQKIQTQEPLNAYTDQMKEDNESHSSVKIIDNEASDLNNSVDYSGGSHDRNTNLESDSKPKVSHEASSDWYSEWTKYRSQSRIEKGKADWIFEKAADREKQRNYKESFSNWVFQRAENRKQRRREERQNDWLFDRMQRHRPCDNKDGGCDMAEEDQSGDWFLKHSNHRNNLRRQASESSGGSDGRMKHDNVHSEKLKKFMHHKHHSHSRASEHDEKRFSQSSGTF